MSKKYGIGKKRFYTESKPAEIKEVENTTEASIENPPVIEEEELVEEEELEIPPLEDDEQQNSITEETIETLPEEPEQNASSESNEEVKQIDSIEPKENIEQELPIITEENNKIEEALAEDDIENKSPSAHKIPIEVRRIHGTIHQSVFDNIEKEIDYRLDVLMDKYVNRSKVVEERIFKNMWTPPEIEPPLTDEASQRIRKYRHIRGSKYQPISVTVDKAIYDNIHEEYNYRSKHGEPNISKSDIIETRLKNVPFIEPEK